MEHQHNFTFGGKGLQTLFGPLQNLMAHTPPTGTHTHESLEGRPGALGVPREEGGAFLVSI